jgi:hypothetical protein
MPLATVSSYSHAYLPSELLKSSNSICEKVQRSLLLRQVVSRT